MKVNFNLDDLTNSALKRLVSQLLSADDAEEKKIMQRLSGKSKGKQDSNDLADLDEEMHGKPSTPKVEDNDDAFDLEVSGDDDQDSESDIVPKKKRKRA